MAPADKKSVAQARNYFPIVKTRTYLNNASIAPMSTIVIGAINEFLEDVKNSGRNNYPNWCDRADTEFKGRIGALIGAASDEIAFVKNTTEGIAQVANGLDWREGDNVVLPSIEYPSNVYPWMNLKKRGVEIRWVHPRNGRIELEDIRSVFNSRTRLLSLSAVQFSTGFRIDLAQLSDLCRRADVLLNLDAIQSVGSMKIDLNSYKVDFLSAGAHKWLLGPIGTGFFYCNKESMNYLSPPTVGYHTVDKHEAHLDYDLVYRDTAGRFEEALVNFPGIWGLDAAVRLQLELGNDVIERYIMSLVSCARDGLQSAGWNIDGSADDKDWSGLLCFSKAGLDLDELALQLGKSGIDLAVRDGKLRVSPSYYNNEDDIVALLDALEFFSRTAG